MCIFLENQNFQKQTEAMMRDMQSNTEKAAGQMQSIAEVLDDQRQGIDSLGEQIVVVDAKQRDLALGIDQGNKEVLKLQNTSQVLVDMMNESLELEVSSFLGKTLFCFIGKQAGSYFLQLTSARVLESLRCVFGRWNCRKSRCFFNPSCMNLSKMS